MGVFNKISGIGGTLLLFLGALQAEMSGEGSNKIYLKGTFYRNLTLNQWMAHNKIDNYDS